LNRNGSLATWDGMPAAFAQRALGHRDCIMPLGNISYLDGDPLTLVNFITLRLPGNQAKQKADRDVAAQNLVVLPAARFRVKLAEKTAPRRLADGRGGQGWPGCKPYQRGPSAPASGGLRR
jgi:hypothetical protein